jgi:uncharacterized protein (TIGR02058 family)|tara:strand:+ start:8293 stop:8664 length:372 start_codon:yes stop_codon:yes gene_type:complete
MTFKRMVVEMGMGTDLQGGDYTKAAVRALRDALWHNSLTVAPAFGLPKESMKIEVTIGVNKPNEVDRDEVKAVLPYGQASVVVVEGGLDIMSDCGTKVTVVANAAAVVYLNIEECIQAKQGAN